MKAEIRLTVDLENPAEVKATIEMLQKFVTTEKKTSSKKTETAFEEKKTEIPAATSSATESEEIRSLLDKKVEERTIKIEEIRALLAKKVEAHRPAIKAKLTEFNAANVTSLKEENYKAFMDFLNTL